MALRPSLATTFSIPRKLGYSSTTSSAFFRTGVSIFASANATELPTVAANDDATAPCTTPPKSTPDDSASTTPPASKHSTFTAVHASTNSASSLPGPISDAYPSTAPSPSLSSGFSVAKSSPRAETRAARPPNRRRTAPAATTNAVRFRAYRASADLEAGSPVSGSRGGGTTSRPPSFARR